MPASRLATRLAMVACAFVLQGCVGIGIVGSAQSDRDLHDVFWKVEQPISTQTMLELRGEPDAVETAEDGTEVWTYDSDLRWGGLLICVVIPIPLVVPVGHESTSLIVKDGVIIAAKALRQTTTLYVAGVVPGICYDYGVGVFYR